MEGTHIPPGGRSFALIILNRLFRCETRGLRMAVRQDG